MKKRAAQCRAALFLSQVVWSLPGVVIEGEEIEKVADRGSVPRDLRVARRCDRVGEVVAAAVRDGRQIPVALDELENRNVICIVV
jgi:hypothetical protein